MKLVVNESLYFSIWLTWWKLLPVDRAAASPFDKFELMGRVGTPDLLSMLGWFLRLEFCVFGKFLSFIFYVLIIYALI